MVRTWSPLISTWHTQRILRLGAPHWVNVLADFAKGLTGRDGCHREKVNMRRHECDFSLSLSLVLSCVRQICAHECIPGCIHTCMHAHCVSPWIFMPWWLWIRPQQTVHPHPASFKDLERLLLAENVQVTNGGVSVMITFPAARPVPSCHGCLR